MSKHLVTIEVDTDRSRFGTDWNAEHYPSRKIPDEDVERYVETLGAGPGDQWDITPYTRVVSVEPAGAELSEEARALIAACVATSDEIDMETLTAPPETWTEVRTAFPLSLYHDSRIIEGGIA